MYPGVYFTTLRGFTSMGSLCGITICKEAIENGLLKRLKGLLLPCYLYLATQANEKLEGELLLLTAMKDLDCTRKDLLKALIELEEGDFIQLKELDPTSEKRPIHFSLNHHHAPKKKNFIESLLEKKFCPKEELVEGLVALYRLPHGQEVGPRLREEIEEWFKVFHEEVIREVLRRAYAWGEKNREGRPFEYLTTILEDLKEAGVKELEDLEKRDHLYHQIKELARSCGIKVHELNRTPVYKQILQGWITSKNGDSDWPLPLDVALFAVEEATRRSSSRHPSLDYIENNFIHPWKEAEIQSVDEARALENSKTSETSPLKEKGRVRKKKKKEKESAESLHKEFAFWAE